MTATLRDFALEQLEPAKQIVKRGKELTPMLIITNADNEMVVVALPEYGNPNRKSINRMIMMELLEKHHADRYAFIMEAWMGSPKTKKLDGNYLPSNDPDRLEAITITAASRDGEKMLLVCKINRSPKGITFEELGVQLPSGPLGDLFRTDTMQ